MWGMRMTSILSNPSVVNLVSEKNKLLFVEILKDLEVQK